MIAQASGRQRLAEVTSGVGAGVLGLGLGALAAAYVGRIAVPLAIAGGALHAWGMYDRMRIERAGKQLPPAWSIAMYWICWIALAGLALYAVVRVAG